MKLNDWIIKSEITNAEFASKVGVTRQAMWRYRMGERMPKPAVIAKIHEVTGGAVTANDFHAVAA